MLSEFELALYAVAKAEGFDSIDEDNETLVRHAIEYYMMEVIWKATFTGIEKVSAPLASLLKANGYTHTNLFKNFKAQLDPNAYNLGDDKIDELVKCLREARFDELNKILEQNPTLIHRRDRNFRTLLHHALVWPNAVLAIEFLLARGASLKMKTASGVDAIAYVIQNHNNDYFNLLLPHTYQSHRQFDVLSVLNYNGDESLCLSVLEKTNEFRFQVNPEQKAALLSAAIEKNYYRLMKALVVSGAPVNMQVNGNTALHTLAAQSVKYAPGQYSKKAGVCSFLLATSGVDLSIRNDQGKTAKETVKVLDLSGDYSDAYVLRDARIYTELALYMNGLSRGCPPVIVLNGADYDSLARAGLLDVGGVIYVVLCDSELSYDICYGNGHEIRTLHRYQLNGDQKALLDALVVWLYPQVSIWLYGVDSEVASEAFSARVKKEQKNIFAEAEAQALAVQVMLTDLLRAHNFLPEKSRLTQPLKPTPISQPALAEEDELIQQLQSQYQDKLIPLYDKAVETIAIIGVRNNYVKLLEYIFSRLQVLDEPKNLKYALFFSTLFYGKRFDDFFVKQTFPVDVPFYQFIVKTGVPLKVEHGYGVDSIEYHAAGYIVLAKEQKGPLARTADVMMNPILKYAPLNELDLLKGIKKRYLYIFENTTSHPDWQASRVSIRDSLVLGSSTLFLNVIRSNRDLTQLKDTDSYIKLCKLMENIEISPEAVGELKERVLVKADPSLRDVVMYLALVCDFEQEKVNFIRVCRDHLLSENVSKKDKAALNAALCLLSDEDHDALRDCLIKASSDPSLLPTLQARLAKKNCAYIEIIRTSAEHREVKNTGKFKTWAAGLKEAQVKATAPSVVESKVERIPEPKVTPPAKKSFYSRFLGLFDETKESLFDPEIHSANFRDDQADEESGLRFPADKKMGMF